MAYFRHVYPGKVDLTPDGAKIIPLTDRQVQEEKLHLAYSRDALHWTAPAPLPQKLSHPV